MNSRIERVTFLGSQGGELAARLDLPATPPRVMALVTHCFTCSKESAASSKLATTLVEHGFGVMRFDFTGQGASDGELANAGFASNVDDVVLAADWLGKNHRSPQLLVGHSLGGAAVIAAARVLPGVRAVATVGAPSNLDHLIGLLGGARAQIERDGEAEVVIAGRAFQVRQGLLDEMEGVRLLDQVRHLGRPLLVLHAAEDEVVDVTHGEAIFAAAAHPKGFVSLDGADHLLTDRTHGATAARLVAAWAERYVVDERGFHEAPRPTSQVVVAETGQGRYLNHVVVGAHRLLTDEPQSVGGLDAGPSPYDLVAAALGACTSMTIRMYAERKGWPLERVRVEVDHAKVHAEDCAKCEEGSEGRIDVFERVVHLEGVLDQAQRRRLLEIADRCPVHRTLESSSQIFTHAGA